jgi:hypothetical protein
MLAASGRAITVRSHVTLGFQFVRLFFVIIKAVAFNAIAHSASGNSIAWMIAAIRAALAVLFPFINNMLRWCIVFAHVNLQLLTNTISSLRLDALRAPLLLVL